MLSSKKHLLWMLLTFGGVVLNSQAETLTDPTRPPGKNETSVMEGPYLDSAIVITAVLKKNKAFYAVINKNWFKKGEKVGAWRITNITSEGVYLKNENEPEARPLKFLVNEKSDFKKQANNE